MAASPRARTSPARKRTAASKPSTVPLDLDGFEPVRLSSAPVAEDRIPLFYVDETEYTIPRTISRGVSLWFLRLAGEIGETRAAPQLLERLLGEEGYQALVDSPSLTDDELNAIIDLAVRVAFGQVENKEQGGKAAGR